MTTNQTANPYAIHIKKRHVVVSRICSIEQSYPLACAAMDLGLDRTTRSREPYEVVPFNAGARAHKRLPGSSGAKAGDYVFTSVVPLGSLASFFELAGAIAA